MGHKITFLGPEGPLEAVAAQLEDGTWNAREAAIKALNPQTDCPKELPDAVAAQSGDEDSGMPRSAMKAPSSRSKLPEVPFDAAATQLEDRDGNVRETGIDALSSSSDCPEEHLDAVAARSGVPKLPTYRLNPFFFASGQGNKTSKSSPKLWTCCDCNHSSMDVRRAGCCPNCYHFKCGYCKEYKPNPD